MKYYSVHLVLIYLKSCTFGRKGIERKKQLTNSTAVFNEGINVRSTLQKL